MNNNGNNQITLGQLKEEIRQKQEELNKIVLEGKDKEHILRFSQELDVLISQYISIKAG
ncbi:MAG: Spo0E family sporulation regulatory protein-aspartic acid phosphatase [Tissierellia bacterium]|nr:Spo0E family sporulation regulatory protein-aspartic acid phosphatase [Tissierellia bacterium]